MREREKKGKREERQLLQLCDLCPGCAARRSFCRPLFSRNFPTPSLGCLHLSQASHPQLLPGPIMLLIQLMEFLVFCSSSFLSGCMGSRDWRPSPLPGQAREAHSHVSTSQLPCPLFCSPGTFTCLHFSLVPELSMSIQKA